MENMITTQDDYWRLVQNPATRISSPIELVRLSQEAIERFSDSHVSASAICVIAYRVIDGDYFLPLSEWEQLLELTRILRDKLELRRDFPSVRWYLSLGLAISALYIHKGDRDGAIKLLTRNIGKLDHAIPHGQPVTNVVKSAVILLYLFKEHGIPEGREWLFRDVINCFAELKGDVFENYKYENHWVYEELSVVYRMIYVISSLAFIKKNNPALTEFEVLQSYDHKIVPEPFYRIIKLSE